MEMIKHCQKWPRFAFAKRLHMWGASFVLLLSVCWMFSKATVDSHRVTDIRVRGSLKIFVVSFKRELIFPEKKFAGFFAVCLAEILNASSEKKGRKPRRIRKIFN